jgi:hypothetical protein
VCRVQCSCFAHPDSFWALPRASGPIFTFCVIRLILGGPRASVQFSCFCAPGLIFGGIEGVGPSFHILLHDSLSAILRASHLVFIFFTTRLVLGDTDGVMSNFHVMRYRTHFGRYRGRRHQFSCFLLPKSFSMVPRMWDLVFMFCAPGIILGGTEGVGSSFHFLRSRTRFRRYRGLRVEFSCFALEGSFKGSTEGAGTSCHTPEIMKRIRGA